MLDLTPDGRLADVSAEDEGALQHRLPSPFIVGERDAQLPVWPLFRQDGSATPLVGHVFEPIDLAPIPGFPGTPPKLLLALGAKGRFMDVAVLSQHER